MEFSKEMRGTHTLYLPAMLDHHFPLVRHAMRGEGYHIAVLKNQPDEDKCPPNCGCYPVSRMVGQMVTALENGTCENPSRSAFLLPPAGAGCAGENHFRPIEMALESAGYPKVPVLALDVHAKQVYPGLSVTPGLVRKSLSAMLLSDMLQLCLMDTIATEAQEGATMTLYKKWVHDLGPQVATGKTCAGSHRRALYQEILDSFTALPRVERPVTKVVVTGEPYLKYCSIGNHDLVRTLWQQGCKVWLSGFVGYGICVVDALGERFGLAGNRALKNGCSMVRDYAQKLQREMLDMAKAHGIDCPSHYDDVKARAEGVLTNKRVDDAWYLGADVLDAMASGYSTVVVPCSNGCLGPRRIHRDAMDEVSQAHPEATVTILDFTAPEEERQLALENLLSILDDMHDNS